MRSSASLAPLALLAACGAASETPRPLATGAPPADQILQRPEAGEAEGPRATAGNGRETGYDAVGYASWYGEELTGNRTATGARFDPAAITAAHRTLPLNSYAEVTALDSGRTILVLVNDRGPHRDDRLIDLSRGAAALLGVERTPLAGVRVRAVSAPPADAAALFAGRPASSRLDAPPGLLTALRRQLPVSPAANAAPLPVAAPPRPARAAPPRAAPPAAAPPAAASTRPGKGRYIVQVAAFSTESRARALADRLDGRVERGAGLWRVRLGPFADRAAAARARDDAARRGYGDATIILP